MSRPEPTEARVKRASRYCVPTAVAYVENGCPEDAARRLLRIQPKSKGWFNMRSAARVLGRAEHYHFVPRHQRVTLARWLKEDGRDAIVSAGHHAHVVEGGRVVWDNGSELRRGLVQQFILLRA